MRGLKGLPFLHSLGGLGVHSASFRSPRIPMKWLFHPRILLLDPFLPYEVGEGLGKAPRLT